MSFLWHGVFLLEVHALQVHNPNQTQNICVVLTELYLPVQQPLMIQKEVYFATIEWKMVSTNYIRTPLQGHESIGYRGGANIIESWRSRKSNEQVASPLSAYLGRLSSNNILVSFEIERQHEYT